MNQLDRYPKGCQIPVASDAMNELTQLAASLESIEIRLSILGVKMHYEESPHTEQMVELLRELAELNRQLTNILVFGN